MIDFSGWSRSAIWDWVEKVCAEAGEEPYGKEGNEAGLIMPSGIVPWPEPVVKILPFHDNRDVGPREAFSNKHAAFHERWQSTYRFILASEKDAYAEWHKQKHAEIWEERRNMGRTR